MTDTEARAFVAGAVAEGWQMGKPEADKAKLLKNSREMVDVIVDNYLKLRYLAEVTPPQDTEKAS